MAVASPTFAEAGTEFGLRLAATFSFFTNRIQHARPPYLRARRALRRGKPSRACRAEARRAKAGGKSELRRAVRRVTPGQGNLKDSGTENIPLAFADW